MEPAILIDNGSYGDIYLLQDNDKKIIIKVFDIPYLLNKSKTAITLIEKEICALKELSLTSASKFIPNYISSGTGNNPHNYLLLMEYVPGEQLLNYSQKWKGDIAPELLWKLMRGLIEGLNEIHNCGFTHGDVKPENIIVTDEQIKYIDFGFSCNRDNIDISSKSKRGTPMYNPPEFFQDYPFVNSFIKAKAHDIWSLGVVMFELAHGLDKVPYDIETNDLAFELHRAPTVTPSYAQDDGRTNKFLTSVLINNWKDRPSINIVYENFLQEIVRENI